MPDFKELIQQINEQTDIVALVSEYVQLEKKGKNYMGLCPFHSEKTPSFSVSKEKHIAKCFSCGEGGGPIDFLSKIKNIPFMEAASELANRLGIKLDYQSHSPKNQIDSKYYAIMEDSLKLFKFNLKNTTKGKIVLEYLHNRGITDDLIDKFHLGLSFNNHNGLYKMLNEKGYSNADLISLGLVKENEYGYYDLFQDRLMFPIFDVDGHPIAFGGRIYEKKDNEPKYVNSPETILFKKGEVIFNLNNALSSIRKNKRIFLVEGFMDVIKMTKAGIEEAVCSMGTALTTNQAELIKRYVDNVVLIDDGDNAGINAAYKSLPILLKAHHKVRICILKNAKDPDEFIEQFGADQFKKFVNENLLDPIEFQYRFYLLNKDLNDSYVLSEVKNNVFKLIKSTNSATIIEKYIAKLAESLHVDKKIVYSDYDSYCNKYRQSPNITISDPYVDYGSNGSSNSYHIKKDNTDAYEFMDRKLIDCTLSSKENAMYISSQLKDGVDYIVCDACGVIFLNIMNYYQDYDEMNIDLLRSLLTDDVADYFDKYFIHQIKTFDGDEVDSIIAKMKKNKEKRNQNELNNKARQSLTDEEKIALYAKKIEQRKK